MHRLEQVERRLDGGNGRPRRSASARAGELAGEVQRLQRELDDDVLRQAGFLERARRARVREEAARRGLRHESLLPSIGETGSSRAHRPAITSFTTGSGAGARSRSALNRFTCAQ